MTDRLQIEITGILPEKGKHAILAAAEVASEALSADFSKTHGMELTAVVRAIRPGKKSAAVAQTETKPEDVKIAEPAPVVHVARPRHEAAD